MNKEVKHMDEFALALCELSPKEFLGVARLLNVKWLTTKFEPDTKKAVPRPAEDIFMDCLEKFQEMSRQERRILLKAAKKWAGGKSDGAHT